ncbi:MAG TPA: adenylate/guanylate cyclase domain-containing protein [Acidimicrobiales bacterium]|nr:adenylate/guanylate cyclase domain-containing protein [Acidimicrobiales bacterium]
MSIEGTGGESAMRVSDEDRSRVADLLRQHTTDGSLTLDEFAERVGVALAAKTRGELDALLVDLPSGAPAAGVATAGDPAAPPDTRRRRFRRWIVGVMSPGIARGRWRPGREVAAVAVMGGCEIDFRRAEIDFDEIAVTAVAIMGGIEITVPEGIDVELTGLAIMGGKHIKLADVPVLPGSPRILVRAFPIMGGVTVRSKPDKAPRDDSPRRGALDRGARGALGASSPALDPANWERQSQTWDRGDPAPAGGPELLWGRHGRPTFDPRVERHVQRIERKVQREADKWGPLLKTLSTSELWRQLSDVADGRDLSKRDLDRVPIPPDGTVTIMFVDICGYSELTERLGDRAAHELLVDYHRMVREQLAAHEGYEVKVQGDGFMIAFSGAARALRCAIAMQKAFEKYSSEHPDEPLQIHQGLHTGEAVRDADDFLGRTVILASRITTEAGPEEILVSSLLRELTDSTREFRFGEARSVTLKGLSGSQTLYPVEWRD